MYPVDNNLLLSAMQAQGIESITAATIRQVCAIAAALEQEAREDMVHLEIGNPGLEAEPIGIEAEINALRAGVANKYPDIAGIPALKNGGSKFIKAFLNIDIPSACIIPTVGSMQGSFSLMTLLLHRDANKDTILFLDPEFPAQGTQAHIVGLKKAAFDIYDFRGDKMEAKLESILGSGKVTAMIYGNPNNPAWTSLTPQELEIIGRLATKYDVVVMEDLAYLGMDFRTDMSHACEAPFVPTVAKYTDNYILLVSGSKIFSYAGQRIAMVCFSEKLAKRHFQGLKDFFGVSELQKAYIFGVLYAMSSGTSHSAQHGFAAMLDAAAEGQLNFVANCREYGRRGHLAKKAFTDAGFNIVYAMDGNEPIGDGFFFTVGWPGMDSEQLQRELLRHGVAAISLPGTGSKQHGVRVCVSMLDNDKKLQTLSQRLHKFKSEHGK